MSIRNKISEIKITKELKQFKLIVENQFSQDKDYYNFFLTKEVKNYILNNLNHQDTLYEWGGVNKLDEVKKIIDNGKNKNGLIKVYFDKDTEINLYYLEYNKHSYLLNTLFSFKYINSIIKGKIKSIKKGDL